jgi:hypothetical protein
MNRLIVYPGAIPLDTDVLNIQKNTMLALGFLAQATLGTSTVVDGLACTPTSPASMAVNVGPGSILTQTTVDATAFGSLAADTADSLVKLGVNLTTTQFTLTAPVSAGQSINYLIEAAFLEQDGTPVVLPYYNATNPAQPYSGPANGGAQQNTVRAQTVQLQLKAGTAANTGTQTTPAVDSGWVGLYVVTVAYGQTTVVAGNISTVSGAPFIAPKVPGIPSAVQAQAGNYAPDTGTTNALAVSLTPAPASLTAGLTVRVKVANTNTGAATINVNGLGATAITTPDGVALAAGALLGGGVSELVYNGSGWCLLAPAFSAANGFRSVQYFTSTGSFTVPAGVFVLDVELWAAGGGGGGSTTGTTGTGGGGGGYARKRIVTTPGTVVPVTVGSGGAGGVSNGNGGNGGTTSFGSFLSATGGAGGYSTTAGGTGGSGVGGDLILNGIGGSFGITTGNAYWGGFGGGAVQMPPPTPNVAGGSPGTGASSQVIATGGNGGQYGGNGGAGGPGLVVVRW